jgi:hypothetical protein
MSVTATFPKSLSWDSDYWLSRCEGFRVDAPAGRLGFVEEVRFVTRLDRPDLLVVRGGLAGRRVLLVPVTQVKEVVPRQERVVLTRSPDEKRYESAQRLRAFLAATFGIR